MRNPNKSWKISSLGLLLGLAFAAGASAQSSSGNITGKAAPGDVAIITNVDTGFSRELKVKDDGSYQMRRLPTGTFTVTVRHPDGSTEQPRQVTLHAGRTARIQ